jgi:hypothetical protein
VEEDFCLLGMGEGGRIRPTYFLGRKEMAYKNIYPDESKLKCERKGSTISVDFASGTKYKPDLWAIKYLFDQGMGNEPVKISVNGEISKTMALRIYFLQYLFPHIEFHDSDSDKYRADAKEIISNIGKKYVTYTRDDYTFADRGTKNKPESLIEKELADNLSNCVKDFSVGAEVIRQFPANIFKSNICEEARVTDKLWIDMVSVNDDGELSPIELKVGGNSPLDLFAQGLDYGIYCHLFKEHIGNNWFKDHNNIAQNKVTIYYVGENFHPALVGRDEKKGIVSLIRKNTLFNIVFVEIAVDKNNRCITEPKVIFDTRNQ